MALSPFTTTVADLFFFSCSVACDFYEKCEKVVCALQTTFYAASKPEKCAEQIKTRRDKVCKFENHEISFVKFAYSGLQITAMKQKQ